MDFKFMSVLLTKRKMLNKKPLITQEGLFEAFPVCHGQNKNTDQEHMGSFSLQDVLKYKPFCFMPQKSLVSVMLKKFFLI